MIKCGTIRTFLVIAVCLFIVDTSFGYNICSLPAVCQCVVEQKPVENGFESQVPLSNQPDDSIRSQSSFFNINVVSADICNMTTPPKTTPQPNGTLSAGAHLQTASIPNIILNCSYAEPAANTTIPSHPPKLENGTFYLTLKYPCIEPEPPAPKKGYSTGTDLLILFFTLLFGYLTLGMAVNYFILGARGLELIPNFNFWRDLPSLVKDGAVFVQNGFKVPQAELHPRSPESYDAI